MLDLSNEFMQLLKQLLRFYDSLYVFLYMFMCVIVCESHNISLVSTVAVDTIKCYISAFKFNIQCVEGNICIY